MTRPAAAAQVGALADAGATWWLETRWGMPDNMPDRVREMTDRLAAGPPGVRTAAIRGGRAAARRVTGRAAVPRPPGDAGGAGASPGMTAAVAGAAGR